jgi:hypothetical protein
MATIEVARDHDVTVFTVVGELTADDITGAIKTDYSQTPTTHILWDLTEGSLSGMTAHAFRQVADVAQGIRIPAPGARTAYVGSDDLAYGLMRMYTALAALARVPAEYQVFRTKGEALAWLGAPANHPPRDAG